MLVHILAAFTFVASVLAGVIVGVTVSISAGIIVGVVGTAVAAIVGLVNMLRLMRDPSKLQPKKSLQ